MSFLRKQESEKKTGFRIKYGMTERGGAEMDLKELKGILSINNGILELKDKAGLKKVMDELIYEAVFTEDKDRQIALFLLIKEAAKAAGAVPASIQGLYEEMGRSYPGFTVPAINIRGLPMTLRRQYSERQMR